MATTFIKINKADNVAVALEELQKGTVIALDGDEIELKDTIPYGHKFLLTDLQEGPPESGA